MGRATAHSIHANITSKRDGHGGGCRNNDRRRLSRRSRAAVLAVVKSSSSSSFRVNRCICGRRRRRVAAAVDDQSFLVVRVCVCDWPLSSVTSRRATVHDNVVGIQHGRVVVVS